MSSPNQPSPHNRPPLSRPTHPSSSAASPFSHHVSPPSHLPGGSSPPPPHASRGPLGMPPARINADATFHAATSGNHDAVAAKAPYARNNGAPPHSSLTTLPRPSSFVDRPMGASSSKPMLPPLPAHTNAPFPFADHASKTPPGAMGTGASTLGQSKPSGSMTGGISSGNMQNNVDATKQSGGSSFRPLNVKDALAYLDQVKMQFADQADVYNRFLDIMKDFKSQIIDTHGVIERVSSLFQGHSGLISGFNTFLPPGYRIECSTDPHEPDIVRVTTPNGSVNTIGHDARLKVVQKSPPQSRSLFPHYDRPVSSQQSTMAPPVEQNPYGSIGGPIPRRPLPSFIPQFQQPPMQSQLTPPAPPSDGRRTPVEFNHAINYVNKIKNRFANEPDKYKQFLEILQTYQKEQRPIQEVYGHVQYLFDGAPDLLEEFAQFLPEISGQQTGPYEGHGVRMTGSLAPLGRKKRHTGVDRSVTGTVAGKTKKSKLYHKQPMEDNFAGQTALSSPETFDPLRPTVTVEEVELFDRIKRHIGNKPSYEEFLKTLNLYTQQVIDLDMLVEQARGFIGNNSELFEWFKVVVEYQPKDQPIERPAIVIPKPDLNHCEVIESSPSYRRVSKEWQNQPCSGRDELCWEVLNDEYVSHPIWASEDSDFAASKKNQYEEAMHRCEEERYDYNLNIDANLNTIGLLEPIEAQIQSMTLEEVTEFKLKPGLGGQSKSIYERIIKKVYGKERGTEIIEMLYNNPGHIVPIVLNRLKQKDEEWKKAQREWNKVWRELDAKNYYRSLDYQGITFKSIDRKAMATKALISEIEAIYEKQLEKQATGGPPVKPQFQFVFEDPSLFKDVTRVIYSYIERQNGFTNGDRAKVRMFICTFIPLFFHATDVVPEGAHSYSDNEEDDTMDEDEESHSIMSEDSETDAGRSPSKRSQSPARRRNGKGSRNHQEEERTVDLLRDVLTRDRPVANTNDEMDDADDDARTRSPSAQTTTTTGDRVNGPSLSPSVGVDEHATSSPEPMQNSRDDAPNGDELFAAGAMNDTPREGAKRSVYRFFCNSTFYCLFRLYQLMYERLLRMKKVDAAVKADPRKGKKSNKVALALGLYSTRFDDIELSNGCYEALLDLVDRFFEGDIDQQVFEEQTRYLFVTEAHVLFTIDKLAHSLVKQIIAVTVDSRSVDLVRLFRKDEAQESVSPNSLSDYQLQAEKVVGKDENLYRVDFDTQTQTMSISLSLPSSRDDSSTEADPAPSSA